MTSRATVRRVDKALAALYGDPPRDPSGDPLGGLIATILSQNTTGRNSRAAFASLRARFPMWEQAALATEADIAAAIRSGGLAAQKAARIRDILRELLDERGELSLDFLADMPPAEALRYLAGFRGVGPKTAACVLLFDLGRDVLPVDTHVFRIAGRLGWLPEKATPESAHETLGALVPPDIMHRLHVNMVRHGRELCRPRNPRCEGCPIARDCRWPGEHSQRPELGGQGARPPAGSPVASGEPSRPLPCPPCTSD